MEETSDSSGSLSQPIPRLLSLSRHTDRGRTESLKGCFSLDGKRGRRCLRRSSPKLFPDGVCVHLAVVHVLL